MAFIILTQKVGEPLYVVFVCQFYALLIMGKTKKGFVSSILRLQNCDFSVNNVMSVIIFGNVLVVFPLDCSM